MLKKLLQRRLKEARKFAGLSQFELAKKLGQKSESSVQNWEAGKSMPRISVLAEIARVTGRPVTWFLGEQITPDLPAAILSAENLTEDNKSFLLHAYYLASQQGNPRSRPEGWATVRSKESKENNSL